MGDEGPHGVDCRTTTWRTRCLDCEARVYFFKCNHGSKVFFDELGPPWPMHDCDQSWARRRRRSVDESGQVVVEIREDVTLIAPPPSFAVDDGIAESLIEAPSSRQPDPIIAMDPPPGASEHYIGILREVSPRVDPLRHYRSPDTTVARASLQQIGQQPVGRITIHLPSPIGDDVESYTAWVPVEFLDEQVRRGATVAVDLEGVRIVGHEVAWFCSMLEVLGNGD